MSNTPKVIYRRHPEHAGTKPVIRAGSPMRTLDPQRLARAGSVSRPVRRRALSKRTVVLTLLLLCVLVVAALVATSARGVHAQTTGEPWCEIGSAPAPFTVCLTARLYLPEVSR